MPRHGKLRKCSHSSERHSRRKPLPTLNSQPREFSPSFSQVSLRHPYPQTLIFSAVTFHPTMMTSTKPMAARRQAACVTRSRAATQQRRSTIVRRAQSGPGGNSMEDMKKAAEALKVRCDTMAAADNGWGWLRCSESEQPVARDRLTHAIGHCAGWLGATCMFRSAVSCA